MATKTMFEKGQRVVLEGVVDTAFIHSGEETEYLVKMDRGGMWKFREDLLQAKNQFPQYWIHAGTGEFFSSPEEVLKYYSRNATYGDEYDIFRPNDETLVVMCKRQVDQVWSAIYELRLRPIVA